MVAWLVNHSWASFSKTQNYCGFHFSRERDKIIVNDDIVYYGQGLVFGIFKAVKLIDNEFNDWDKKYPYQVKIEPVVINKNGVSLKYLQQKIQIQRTGGASSNLVKLNDTEFNQVKQDMGVTNK